MFGQTPFLFVADDEGLHLRIAPEALWLSDFWFLQGALGEDLRGRSISPLVASLTLCGSIPDITLLIGISKEVSSSTAVLHRGKVPLRTSRFPPPK